MVVGIMTALTVWWIIWVWRNIPKGTETDLGRVAGVVGIVILWLFVLIMGSSIVWGISSTSYEDAKFEESQKLEKVEVLNGGSNEVYVFTIGDGKEAVLDKDKVVSTDPFGEEATVSFGYDNVSWGYWLPFGDETGSLVAKYTPSTKG